MTKKTRKKRKISPIKKALRKKNLAKNIIIVLLIILSFLAVTYFLFDKDIKNIKIEKSDNILKEKKLYTNEEVMEEVLSNINSSKKDILIDTIKKLDEKEAYEENLKKDIKDDVFKKVEEIEKEEPKKITQENNKNIEIKEEPVSEIKDEIIEDPKQKKEDKKSLITKKDSFKYDSKSKPKLAIVIDDVVTKTQKDKIINLGYPVTMAFLPPTKGHPESAKIAKNLPFYMIHFPLQASSGFKNFEENTLNINDSYETIEKRVKKLREWYPNAIYTNNHTGSVFTQNYEAMDKLFRALKKYNFIFVDSKTSPNSTAKELSIKYKMPYIVRDVFLDNDRDFVSVQKQLKSAINIAKKNGYAIAIGHPYDITLKVLKESKNLLNEVELIFINQLPYL
ncbi:divergent polysaccharide deacetylase family protein [Aliarcobacter vitoriensis]|uniref:divergent polysaccharide deacetylase family protein n=1 Tax=Aliarcobacter vitoriensis TaxID=2011099 RepID=UPI003AAB1B9E